MADVTTADVLALCREAGFALAGVAEAAPTRFARELTDWLAAGRHGEMAYLGRNVELRLDPGALLPGARSIICVADRYAAGRPDRRTGAPQGRIARYARGDDYHKVMKKRLHLIADRLRARCPEDACRVCVDTAPILEREHAQRAGLGAVGKHTLLIEQGVGSYLLLGEIITTIALEPTADAEAAMAVDPCAHCTQCIDACPTDAITPWSVDATKCISYLTIEHRSEIDEPLHAAVGDWIFGCDICQEVCPHNQPTRRSSAAEVHASYEPRHDAFDLLSVLDWDERERRTAFTRSALKRAKLPMMKRNALIVAGNLLAGRDHPELRARIGAIADDAVEPEVVRATARAVLARHNGCG